MNEMRIPTTGCDAAVLSQVGDRTVARALARENGVPSPVAPVVTAATAGAFLWSAVRLPVWVQPAFQDGLGWRGPRPCRTSADLQEQVRRVLAESDAALLDEVRDGVDVVVPFLEGVGDGLLPACELLGSAEVSDQGEALDDVPDRPNLRCPAVLPEAVQTALRVHARRLVRVLGLRDYGLMRFFVSPEGIPRFMEASAHAFLGPVSPLLVAAGVRGIAAVDVVARICETAQRRRKSLAVNGGRDRKGLRVGFVYNLKRIAPTLDGDQEAEYDAPKTVEAIRGALERLGHAVLPLEANETLPQRLSDAQVDVVFNVAEGWGGRTREAQVPALCDMLGVPHTGSDATALSIAMDKALAKDLFLRNGVPTPSSQLFRTPRDRLDRGMLFPLIVKPNAEGSSKGIRANAVVHTEEDLRVAVREAIGRYNQPVLVEQYVAGREFTVALFQTENGFKVLPSLEVVFLNKEDRYPVYSYEIKQDWDKNVRYDCPANIDKRLERTLAAVSKRAFRAIGCRDYARVDIRMGGPDNRVPYVLEVNPLPGLTPDFSDMCLIANAAGIPYDSLIATILRYAGRRSRRRLRFPAPKPAPAGGEPPVSDP
jgi:D-alanine-D-alanine ligase